MFTCLLCQLSSGSSNMITTLECLEMLSGCSYLLIWSPGHLTTVKKKTPPKHHPAPNHLRCGPRSSSSTLLFPCQCSLQFHKWYLFFPQALPHLGSGGGLESGVSPEAGCTCKQESGRGRTASHHHHHGSAHQSASTRAGGWDLSARPLPVARTGKLVPCYCCPTAAPPAPRGRRQRFRPHCANTAAPFLHTDNNSAALISRSQEPWCGHRAATTDGGPRSG